MTAFPSHAAVAAVAVFDFSSDSHKNTSQDSLCGGMRLLIVDSAHTQNRTSILYEREKNEVLCSSLDSYYSGNVAVTTTTTTTPKRPKA